MVSDDFYRALEDRFRGSRDVIKRRQSVYMPFVEALSTRIGKKMLDVGCGRAEWLELLKERGIESEGLDLNEDFVRAGQEMGLSVFRADAMEHLRAQADGAYAFISAFHVVEHLGFNNLLAFLKEAHRVVDDGGAILLETPNPANLVVGACNFYLDPTHERPIPSILLSFAAEYSGFERVVVVPVNRGELHNDLQLMPGELTGATVINKVVSALDQNLMQAPDYAIIAFKKQDADLIRIAESLVSASPLSTSKEEEEDVNALIERVLEAEKEAVLWREKAAQTAESLRRAEQAAVDAQSRAAAAEADANSAKQQVVALVNSTTWRMMGPVRGAVQVLKTVGFSRAGAKRVAKPVLVRGAAFLHAHPKLKDRVAWTLRRFPALRSRLVGIAGNEALGTAPAAPAVESVEQLTARARTVYQDLLQSKKSNHR
ncbi:putative Type 11 methyltransferase [Paraburkholderia piptadeniae]|uniref:Type 11 methyltransferase n=1 Tax=Paraburkholderia piptadeniae TaxID=1701573 RepID=A0A1N7SRU4_9BURK|nr:class I SAM-dependent methyltransferase [Paraburkholderia piptadeniae]SIT50128.1 putative Type 11 methyltransferase [Paraburkholderia piptadeniae]